MAKDFRHIDTEKNMSKPKLKIKSLYKIFGPKGESYIEPVKNGISKQELLDNHGHVLGLNDINLDIPEQRIQVIMGLSGSGKSTLIRHINRLIEPTAGEITVDDEDILSMSQLELREFRRKKTSMVFQKFALLPHKTVAQNVAYGLTIQGEQEGVAKEKSHKWIESVGLSGFEERYPSQLSGGMQQRVALARCLINDPDLILMDEPLGALDALTREKMQSLVLKIWKETGKTIILITHSVEEALLLGEKVYVMAPRPGRIHKEYKLPFASMGLNGDLREIKNNKEFVSKREEILSMIWDMEEEIMGKDN